MNIWQLSGPAVTSLTELPETGMGFQLVEAVVWGKQTSLLVLNADHAIDISDLELSPGNDPATVLNNGQQIMAAINFGVNTPLIAAPQPHSFRLLNTRIGPTPSSIGPAPAAALSVALPSSLIKRVTLSNNRLFFRFSAFNPDRRVDPVTGNFLAGTYASPESEVPFVPTGFVAVGRFALPNSLPASYRYEIEAPTGTAVDFGTVAPAFGQAGGGVEAYFASGVINAKSPATPVTKMPDE